MYVDAYKSGALIIEATRN